MAHITLHNPVVLSARRGRSTTVINVTDQDGSPVDLVFTSLPVMDSLARQLSSAVARMREAEAGGIWLSSTASARATRRARRAVWGVLQRLGLLDPPYRPL